MSAQDPNEDRSFHTVITAAGSATHWQSRISYYHFLKVKKACVARGNCQMVRVCNSDACLCRQSQQLHKTSMSDLLCSEVRFRSVPAHAIHTCAPHLSHCCSAKTH